MGYDWDAVENELRDRSDRAGVGLMIGSVIGALSSLVGWLVGWLDGDRVVVPIAFSIVMALAFFFGYRLNQRKKK